LPGTLAVPLSQLEVVHGDDEPRQAVEDWHYWVETGYEF
jgi:Calcium binding